MTAVSIRRYDGSAASTTNRRVGNPLSTGNTLDLS